MPDYRLAKAAKDDLIGIARYGDKHFGVAQSTRYRDQLKQRFLTLAKNPLHYSAVDHIREGYRRSVCGVHAIYYRIEGQDVEIIRVLGRQDTHKSF